MFVWYYICSGCLKNPKTPVYLLMNDFYDFLLKNKSSFSTFSDILENN